MADYLELTCRLEPELDEGLAELLSAVPVLGAQVLSADPESISVVIYLDGSRAADAAVLRGVLESAGARDLVLRELGAEDWLAGWRTSARPFEVGERWWIDPHPDAPTAAPDGRLRLAVEPRSAFGSGTHESTRLVLAELEQLPLAGRSVLDVGTGSGILAVAAASLGASPVVAFDLDPEAVWVSRRTVAEQRRRVGVLMFAGPLDALSNRPFDIVLCNMITEESRPLLPGIRGRLTTRGHLVLSGALAHEADQLRADLRRAGLAVRMERQLGEWLAVTAGHDGGS
jgi:ribosomal protein L11 methyltransferase